MSILLRTGKPSRKPELWLRQADRENALYDPATGTVHLLNTTAAAIWVLCDGETHPEEMVEAICELSGLPTEVVVEDVRRILLQFEEADILTWKE
jgi:coenzyme PQQ synthesis protein D (PqqD)